MRTARVLILRILEARDFRNVAGVYRLTTGCVAAILSCSPLGDEDAAPAREPIGYPIYIVINKLTGNFDLRGFRLRLGYRGVGRSRPCGDRCGLCGVYRLRWRQAGYGAGR